jgi:ATPase subunit of ABC transporter with duplicated ATPase domains
MTHHNQTKQLTTWFLNLPLDESIDNKSTKFEVRIQDPMKHSYKTQKAKKSSRRSSRRRKTAKVNNKQEKRQSQAKWQTRARKSSKEQEKLKINTPPNTLNTSSPPLIVIYNVSSLNHMVSKEFYQLCTHTLPLWQRTHQTQIERRTRCYA